MAGGGRARLRWVVLAVVVVALVASTALWFGSRPGLSGDVTWEVTASEIGFDAADRIYVSEVAGDLVALESRSAAAVVDADGRPVLTDLPAPAWELREDGSGWGNRFEASHDAPSLVGWDAEGRETFTFRAADDLPDLLDAAGVETGRELPAVTVQAHGDDVVVLGGCESTSPSESYAYVIGLDTRSGEVVWSEQTDGRCFPIGQGDWDAGSFHPPLSGGGPERLLDTATGEEVWQAPVGARAVTTLAAGVLWWQDGALHLLDRESGEAAWERQLCEEDGGEEVEQVGDFDHLVLAGCAQARWVVDVASGRARELPDGAAVTGGLPSPEQKGPSLGSVLIRSDGTAVAATDPVSGRERWAHDVTGLGDAVLSASFAGPRATVVLGSDGSSADDGPAGSTTTGQLVVLDARTGALLAETADDEARWTVDAGDDGSTLVVRLGDDDADLYWVSGSS